MKGMVDGEKLSKEFMGAYHEKQIGSLCAVHCMNNLLQGPYFDEIMLADVAHEMDRQERAALGGANMGSESGNVRADGFFSVQVIQSALQQKGFDCIPIGSESAGNAMQQPSKEMGFILNRSEHWFALRRIGRFWFDFNSTMEKPKAVSDEYLAMLLQQSKADGYSVFIVRGSYPRHSLEGDTRKLDSLVAACKEGSTMGGGGAVQKQAPAAEAFSGQGYSMTAATAPSSTALEEALASAGVDANADPELAAAIAASLSSDAGGGGGAQGGRPQEVVDEKEEMRRRRLARFG